MDIVLRIIAMAVKQIMEKKSKRIDQYIEGEAFDKITVYRCGNRVIRIDLHLDQED
jgi:hypothetical protein